MATNIDIVRTGYERFNRGDIQTTLALFAEDIDGTRPSGPSGRPRARSGGATRRWQDVHAHPRAQELRLEPHEFYGDGDNVSPPARSM